MTTKTDTKTKATRAGAKPRPKSGATKSKAKPGPVARANPGTKTRSKAGRAKGSTGAGSSKRLRPGELDGIVVAHLRRHKKTLPVGASVVAKEIGRSSGAVANCLERLAKADDSRVRRIRDKPRAYDLSAESKKKKS